MVQVKDVTFGYSLTKKVLDHFSLNIEENGVYGLLGENGTGKSTLLYLIMGLLRPQGGSVTFDTYDTAERRPEALEDMFIVPEEYDLPAIKLSQYVQAIKPFYPNFSEELLGELLQAFNMTDEDINLGALSMGQKKKVYMCVALAARTKLLVMDEPTNGLDIPSKSQFRKVIAKGMRDDQTIIISTHQVRDVELLLDHVIIIDRNRVLLQQPINVEEPVNLEELFIKTTQGN